MLCFVLVCITLLLIITLYFILYSVLRFPVSYFLTQLHVKSFKLVRFSYHVHIYVYASKYVYKYALVCVPVHDVV